MDVRVGVVVAVAEAMGVGVSDGGMVKVGGMVAVGTAVTPGAAVGVGTAVSVSVGSKMERGTAVGGDDAQATPPHEISNKIKSCIRISRLSDHLPKLTPPNSRNN